MEGSASRSRWMSVKNVMTRDVICIRATDDIKDSWLILMEADISGAPVVDDSGGLVGVLSITDIFRAIIERVQKARALRESISQRVGEAEADKEEIRELSLAIRAVAEMKVEGILPKEQKIHTLGPGDSLDRAIHMIAEFNINRLPVVQDNRVVGIVTRQDVIRVMAGRSG